MQDHFILSHIADYVDTGLYERRPLSLSLIQMLVLRKFCPTVLVCDVDYTSFHFGMCGVKFVLCLFGQKGSGRGLVVRVLDSGL